MSRSRQAFQLARHLTETAGARLELVYDSGDRWTLHWTDGPVHEEMRARLDAALAESRFATMRDRTIRCFRSYSVRGWAARAIASRRAGTLGPAVAAGAAFRRDLGVQLPRFGTQNPREGHEYYALLSHIEDLWTKTSYPERASEPEDEPLIEQLLAAGTQEVNGRPSVSEYAMAHALLASEQAPAAGQPPRLTVVRPDGS